MKSEEIITALADSACAARLCDQSWETVVRAVLSRLAEIGMSEEMYDATNPITRLDGAPSKLCDDMRAHFEGKFAAALRALAGGK